MGRPTEECVALVAYVSLQMAVFSAGRCVHSMMREHIVTLAKQFATRWARMTASLCVRDQVLIQLGCRFKSHRTFGALFRSHLGVRRLQMHAQR